MRVTIEIPDAVRDEIVRHAPPDPKGPSGPDQLATWLIGLLAGLFHKAGARGAAEALLDANKSLYGVSLADLADLFEDLRMRNSRGDTHG